MCRRRTYWSGGFLHGVLAAMYSATAAATKWGHYHRWTVVRQARYRGGAARLAILLIVRSRVSSLSNWAKLRRMLRISMPIESEVSKW